jgi:AAA ATPase-like protein
MRRSGGGEHRSAGRPWPGGVVAAAAWITLEVVPGTVSLLSAGAQDGAAGQGRDGRAAAIGQLNEVVSALAGRCAGTTLRQGEGGPTAVFATAADAVACALALQREPAGRAAPPRVGVHSAEASRWTGVRDPGPALSHCGYLRDSASAGQVVVSQASADLAAGRLPPGATLADLGWHRLPDLGPPEHLWQLCHPDLQADFCPLHTLDSGSHNLPVQLTTFIGRHDELEELARLLREARLVTVTGSGGCGKTRLAFQAAARHVGEHPDGVWVAELAPLHDPAQLPGAIAAALSLREPAAASELDALGAAARLAGAAAAFARDTALAPLPAVGGLTAPAARVCRDALGTIVLLKLGPRVRR